LAAERAGERKALCDAQAEIERLRLIVQKLQRLQFGRRAERLDSDQLELGLEDLVADIGRAEELLPAEPSDKDPVPRDHADRPSLPEHLAREEMSLDLDMKTCPCCGSALHAIGETVSEMLDWVPARLIVCSLITTVKLNACEPYAYLKDVLERMTNGHPASRLDHLPWNWKPQPDWKPQPG
jgi:hypothetical protein